MSLIRHALQPRWLGYLALAVVFAVITSLFGLWQWDRREQAVAEINRVEANYDLSAVAFSELLPAGVSWDDDLRWRSVIIEGRYRPEDTTLVRTRPRIGQVGFEVLIPFGTLDGQVILVNRGWVPSGESDDVPDLVPEAPSGVVTVTGRLFPSEPLIPGRSAPEGQIATIHLDSLAETLDSSLEKRAYVALTEEDPAVSPTPLLLDRPVADEGPHLSYTFQWFLFGILGFIAWGYLLREDLRGSVRPDKARVGRSDQEEEDALLDEWEKTH